MIIIRRQTFTMPIDQIPGELRQLGFTIQMRYPQEFAVNSTFLQFVPMHDHCIAATITQITDGIATMWSTISEQRVAVVMKRFT